jgi:BirA family transcriptional regulator, biotin operon repressor / biotin---[acetyl-CoA-carboxylase] ligase
MDTSQYQAGSWPDARVVIKESTSSTMDDALALAREGCPTGTAVVAGFQDRGRGRVPGRTWLSPPWESLLTTVVIRLPDLGGVLHELPLRAGTAVAQAVEDLTSASVEIKWPNDVMGQGRKLAGLLCEAHGAIALVGIGVNCRQRSFPPEISATACSLYQVTGHEIDPLSLLPLVLSRLKESLAGGQWLTLLRARLYGRGRVMRVDLLGSGRSVEGMIQDVDEQGRLVLVNGAGERVVIAQGEISADR